jgi:pimeloyl-ACP methyl ester carboxylesterase
MDDLDEVREALGYEKINLAGFSYGATAAQYYLLQHEEQVRSVFLYGGSLLDVPVFERWAQNGQRSLDLIFDLCLADSDCGAAFPNLREEFSELLERLATQPVTGSFTGPNDPQPVQFTFTSDLFAAVIRHMTKDAKHYPRLPLLIHRAYQEGDYSEFTEYYAENGYEWWGDQIMEHVIRCGEKWAAFDPNEVARLSEGSYLEGWDVSLAQNQAFSCKYTPRGEMPEGVSPQTVSPVPVLVINSEMDPIDPPDNMAGAKVLWPNSLSLVLPYHGHSLSDYEGIRCLWSIENEFIQSGSVNGLNTDCLKEIQPPVFNVPAAQVLTPPATPTPPTSGSIVNSKPIFKTSIGDLAIEAVRWVDEANGVAPGPDEKLLLISISKSGQQSLIDRLPVAQRFLLVTELCWTVHHQAQARFSCL